MDKEDAISKADAIVDLVIKAQSLPQGQPSDAGGRQMAEFITHLHQQLTAYYETLP